MLRDKTVLGSEISVPQTVQTLSAVRSLDLHKSGYKTCSVVLYATPGRGGALWDIHLTCKDAVETKTN